MKATVQQQQLLLDLQSIDNKWRRNRAKADALPETEHVKTIIKQRKAIAVKKAHLQEDVQAICKQRDGALRCADDLQDSLDQLDARMTDPNASAKVLQALQRQKTTTESQKNDAQEQVRQAESKMTELQTDIAILEQNDAKLNQLGEEAMRRRAEKLGKLREKMGKLKVQRAACVNGLPQDVYATYMALAQQASGRVVVKYENGRIDGASVEPSAADASAIVSAAEDEIVVLDDAELMVVRVPSADEKAAALIADPFSI